VRFKHEYKSWFVWKHKYEMLLLLVVTVSVFSVMIISASWTNKDEITAAAPIVDSTTCYELVINGVGVGIIEDTATGETAYTSAMLNIKNILGYDPELKPEVRFNQIQTTEVDEVSAQALSTAIEAVLIEGIDVIREQAYVMKIGDDFKIAVASIEDAEAILQAAQDNFVSGDKIFAVSLLAKEYNGLVLTPNVSEIYAELDSDKVFVSAADPADTVIGNIPEEASDTADGIIAEDMIVIDPMYVGDTTAVMFSEPVMVAASYVDPSDILDVQTATEAITKENEEPKTYVIESGDCPSTIAEDHDMTLSSLYEMNTSLEENASKIQAGDELIVMVPEPELSVATFEEVVYVEAIARSATYVENPDKYVGNTTTIYNGYDGELQVTATLTKLNGKENSRIITNETVLLEPDDRIIEKGTKPLPSKGAVGTFIPPVVDYHITSKYGPRWGSFHSGLDMAATRGTTIRASDGGVVTFAGWNGNYGNLVIIDHGNGVTTRYGHMSKISVSVSQYVSQYEKIGEVGSTGRSTGPHVHFEIRFDGTTADPLSYLEYL
jgi:murein DD-endopeptidase MepM/ murein hydrolase activator NlpD